VLAALVLAYAAIFLPLLPNSSGTVGADYSVWLPNLLVGYFWHLNNGLFALPWFSPAQCGGVPFYADPEMPYLSVPQFLTFIMPPLQAVQASFPLFAAIGFAGAFQLARGPFRLSRSASLLAGTVFMFNNFYAARMLAGHLTFQPFMLAPALAAIVLANPAANRTPARTVLPLLVGGFFIAIMIQGGAVHSIPPALLSIVTLCVMHAITCGASVRVPIRFAIILAVGCALSAGKLAAGLALVANFPRDQYTLPGIPGFWT
jgi:hypothetical protein